jgi:hypothetical protein
VCTGGTRSITAAVGRQRSQQAPVIGPAYCTELVSTAHTNMLSVRLYCALTGTAVQTLKEQQQQEQEAGLLWLAALTRPTADTTAGTLARTTPAALQALAASATAQQALTWAAAAAPACGRS